MIRKLATLGLLSVALNSCLAPLRENEPAKRAALRPAVPTKRPIDSRKASLGSLSLSQALDFAKEHPHVRAARERVLAAGGREDQAGRWRNPQFRAGFEAAPTGRSDVLGNAEYVIGVMQQFPIGGRMGAAKEAARARLRVAQEELDRTVRRAQRDIKIAYLRVAVADRSRELRRQQREWAREIARASRVAFDLGDISMEVLTRDQLSLAEADTQLAYADVERDESKAELSRAVAVDFEAIGGLVELSEPTELRALEDVGSIAFRHPDARAALGRLDELDASLREARRRRVPDLQVAASYRRLSQQGVDSFDFGVAIPLPLFDRRSGAIAAAKANRAAAADELELVQIELRSRLLKLRARARELSALLRLFDDTLLPRAKKLESLGEESQRVGELSRIEYLRARWARADLELRRLGEFMGYERVAAELGEFEESELIARDRDTVKG
ncbi:MAG: TolC family protein [Planctomycetota bacterium]